MNRMGCTGVVMVVVVACGLFACGGVSGTDLDGGDPLDGGGDPDVVQVVVARGTMDRVTERR